MLRIYQLTEDKGSPVPYEVTLNGIPADLSEARVSAIPFNTLWPGHQRPLNQTEISYFTGFESDEKITVRVKSEQPFQRAVIRPLSARVKITQTQDTATFVLERAGNYVLELDDEHRCLQFFYNRVSDCVEEKGVSYFFGKGKHYPGLIRLKSGDRVYIDSEAVVYGSFLAKKAEDIRIFGGGVVDGSYEERLTDACYEDDTKGNMRFYECRNLRIEDVVFRNSANWCLSLFCCSDVRADRIKMVGQWRYNTDGVDIVNSQDIRVSDSYLRVFDDVVTIKGIPPYRENDCRNIFIENCVLWCGWGRTCEVGIETCCERYQNIVFRNCDLIHNSAACLDIQNGDDAEIDGVCFENINVEYQSSTMPEIFQADDAQIYDGYGKTHVPFLINIDNHQYTTSFKEKIGYKERAFGMVRNVLFRNIRVFSEENNFLPPVRVKSMDQSVRFKDIRLEDIWVDGRKIESIGELQTESDIELTLK